MNETRVRILGGAAPYYPPRLTALWHSLGLMPRECPASAGRVTATWRGPLLSRAASYVKFGLSGIFQPLRITSGGCKSVVCNSAFLHTARLVATRHPTGSWD